MFPHAAGIVETAALISIGMLIVALALTFGRLWRGPDLPNRVIALDLVGAILIGFIGAFTVLTGMELMLNAATVLALIVFLGTVAFARYFERTPK